MSSIVKAAAPIVGGALGGPAGAAIGSAIAGGIGGKASRQQVGTSTTNVDLPSYIKPAYGTAVSEAQRIYDEGGFGAYQQLSPYELALLQQGMNIAATPSQFQQPAELATQELLSGGASFLSPAQSAYQSLQEMPSAVSQLQGQVGSLLAPTREKIMSQFAGAGRLGSGSFAESLGRGEVQALAPYLQEAQKLDLNRMLGAASGLTDLGRIGVGAAGAGIEAVPMASQIPYSDIARGLEFGGLLSAQKLAADQSQAAGLKEYADLLRTLTFGQQQTSPLYGDVGGPSTGEKVLSAIAQPVIQSGLGKLGGFLSGMGTNSDPYTGYKVPNDIGTFLSSIGFE